MSSLIMSLCPSLLLPTLHPLCAGGSQTLTCCIVIHELLLLNPPAAFLGFRDNYKALHVTGVFQAELVSVLA